MKMIVCVKQVIDPEEPPSSFGVNATENKIELPPGVPSVVSPFDKNAAEAALQLKDALGGTVTALSVGSDLQPPVLRDPIAMGADDLILVDDEVLASSDSWTTANGLAAAINKIDNYDVVLCGRQDSENDAGQVGTLLAKLLSVPCVTLVKKIDVSDGKATIERVTDDGHEVVSVDLPVVITVSNELGEPRYPTVKQTMKARKVKPTVWTSGDIGLTAEQVGPMAQKLELVKLFKPDRKVDCNYINGATPEEMGANLAIALRESNLL